MNVGRKLMLIVVTSVALVTIPAAVKVYQFTKDKLLTSEATELAKETNAIIAVASQNLAGYELSLKALSSTLSKTLAMPPQKGEEEAFDRLIQKSPDGAWRSHYKSKVGDMQSGIFLPPDATLSAEQKRLHLRGKQVLDAFSSSITSPTGNIWLLTLDKSEIIFDYSFPNFVDEMKADTDYTQTPWMTLGDPATNPQRRLRWTPPIYDEPSKHWLISAVIPIDVNGRWVGTIGRDLTLADVLSTLLQHSKRYEDEQQFLIDSKGNFIQAGPWQSELEAQQGNFKLDLSNEPSLAELLSHKDVATSAHIYQHEVRVQGRNYLSVDIPITVTGWHYYRLVPTNKILGPLRQLFYALVAMVLATGLLVGFLIDIAVKQNIVNRLQVLADAVRKYGLGELSARANLTGDDEIAKTSQEFNDMANQFEATLNALPDMLFEFGLDGTYYSVHTPTDDYLLAPASELIGKTVPKVLPADQAAPVMAAIREANKTGYSQGKQYQRMTSQGLTWFELSIAKKTGGDSRQPRFMAISRNITERKLAAEKIQHLAFYDSLTGLPNRRLLLDRVNHALATSARSGRSGALLFLDLDNFKTLNDTLGHSTGDQLLQEVGKRLTECLREGDTIARLGGDEYVAVLEDLSNKDIETAAQAEIIANKILTTLNRPYTMAVRDYHSTASIGVTLFNGRNITVEEVLRQADIAMYQAKKAGRNTVRFFNPQMQENITQRAELESELRAALEQKQFQLYYQIQVDKSGGVLGAEALIRWAHPTRGLLQPLQFIPLAEETGLILSIGDWVLETACAQIKAWQRYKHTSHIVLSINVSAKQFHQDYFVEQVQAAVHDNGINPALLKLELTESMLLNDADSTIERMSALKELGVQFSLDDFGTGYSSLQYLKRIPLNQLKIDHSFVRDIAVDASDQAIVQTIIAMAKTLNLNVIAEGVETKKQQELLLASGCKHFQGFLFGKPMLIKDFDKKLSPKVNLKLRPKSKLKPKSVAV